MSRFLAAFRASEPTASEKRLFGTYGADNPEKGGNPPPPPACPPAGGGFRGFRDCGDHTSGKAAFLNAAQAAAVALAAPDPALRAVVNNRTRLLSGVAHLAFKLRAEIVERGFALILDRGGMRRAWLRGRENLHKRYLIHVAGYNLGLIMRLLTDAGTPRAFQARVSAYLATAITPAGGLFVLLIVVAADQTAAVALSIERDHSG